jgi:hypothetical protein
MRKLIEEMERWALEEAVYLGNQQERAVMQAYISDNYSKIKKLVDGAAKRVKSETGEDLGWIKAGPIFFDVLKKGV